MKTERSIRAHLCLPSNDWGNCSYKGEKSLAKKSWLKKGMAYSSILAWRIPWTDKPGRLHGSIGSQRVGHDCSEITCKRHGYVVVSSGDICNCSFFSTFLKLSNGWSYQTMPWMAFRQLKLRNAFHSADFLELVWIFLVWARTGQPMWLSQWWKIL